MRVNDMSRENMTRTSQREKVMQSIYQLLFDIDNNIEYDATAIINSVFNTSDFSLIPEFAQKIYVYALDNFDGLKKMIENNLTTWSYERLDPIVKAVLFTALSEYIYVKDTPKTVVINEAIKLTKSYASVTDYKFVNSLLDKVL